MASSEAAVLFGALPDQVAPKCAGSGAPRLRCAERGQVEWRPFSLDQLVPEDHRVRLVWRFVEGLDLAPLLAGIKAVEGHAGHAAADPRILLALWLYATVKGIGSARELARLCEEHIAFRWLCGGVGMNAKTLADFRVGSRRGAGAAAGGQLHGAGAGGRGKPGSCRAGRGAGARRGGGGVVSPAFDLGGMPARGRAGDADLRTRLEADPGSASRQQAAARQRAAEERERRVRAALAVTEELQAQQREKARLDGWRAAQEAERATQQGAAGRGQGGEDAGRQRDKSRVSRAPPPPMPRRGS